MELEQLTIGPLSATFNFMISIVELKSGGTKRVVTPLAGHPDHTKPLLYRIFQDGQKEEPFVSIGDVITFDNERWLVTETAFEKL